MADRHEDQQQREQRATREHHDEKAAPFPDPGTVSPPEGEPAQPEPPVTRDPRLSPQTPGTRKGHGTPGPHAPTEDPTPRRRTAR